MKLSKRLELIYQHVNDSYDHIWDCCCDHGLLGAKLLSRSTSAQVHFVDVVPTILDKLTQQLLHFFPHSNEHPKWFVHCLDVALLPLNHYLNQKHLIIITGVGGELTAKLVEKITAANPASEIEFILCPVHHTYHLRKQLIALKLTLIDEQIITENKRFYELIHVSKRAFKPLCVTGSINMWQTTNHTHHVYLKKLILHYQKIATAQSENEELLAYQALLSTFVEDHDTY